MLKKINYAMSLSTSLPPTFYNHMINEAMFFYKTLKSLQTNAMLNPLLENINLHIIWLPDASGHAATIACDLDPTNKSYKRSTGF